jgi:hypothetical protein
MLATFPFYFHETEMKMVRPSPVLVTGIHRSGTTWVGKMLAAAPGVVYINEPLTGIHRSGTTRVGKMLAAAPSRQC